MIDEIVSTILKEFKKFPLSINFSETSPERIGEFRVAVVIMAFCDSHLFNIGEDGHVYHKTDGSTWAEKVIDGVDLDLTIMWGSGRNDGENWKEEETGEVVVGSRNSSEEVHEVMKTWGKERGEGKFRREKKIPQKKIKKYPTKPKPKNSWHKRLSKIARELDMEEIGSHTEERAVQEIGDIYDEIATAKEQEEEAYWEYWKQEVEENPGNYAVISVKILVDRDGVSVHDIDAGGVKRCQRSRHFFGSKFYRGVMEMWDELPSTAFAKSPWRFSMPGFSFQTYDFFTYWDEVREMYVWNSMNKHSWMCGGWREHFDYYPNIDKMREIFCLDKQFLPFKEIGTLSKWINGIEWSTVWVRMDEIRTRFHGGREHTYFGGDDFENRSREGTVYTKNLSNYQIPRMKYLK